MKKLVIFDLDGTILNTIDDIADCMNYALKENNFAQKTVAQIRSYVGNGQRQFILRCLPENTDEETVIKVEQEFRSRYTDHSSDKTRPFAGIPELIESLKRNGIKVAVNTNKPDIATQPLLAKQFGPVFDFAIGNKPGLPHKPDPSGVELILAALNAEKKDTVFVGDSEVDIQTARNAGIDCISVVWGFKDRDFLEANGAACIVSSPDEILEYCCKN